MGSHKGIGPLTLYVPSPLRFKKKPSAFNMCIAEKLRGGTGPTKGGRYDKTWQKKFVEAAKDCGASLSAAAKKKWGIA